MTSSVVNKRERQLCSHMLYCTYFDENVLGNPVLVWLVVVSVVDGRVNDNN